MYDSEPYGDTIETIYRLHAKYFEEPLKHTISF